MIALMCECLQKGASSASFRIDGEAVGDECFGDVECPTAVTLKMAERRR